MVDLSALANASDADLAFLDAERRWSAEARDKQKLPLEGWSVCLAMAGRLF